MVVAVAILLPSSLEASGDVKARQEDLKSVYIFNFIRFTDWPEKSEAITLNILYDRNIHNILQQIAQKQAGQQLGLRLQSCKQRSCIQDSLVLYIGDSDRSHFGQLLKLVEGRPILTISDIPGFAEQGGMIEIKYHNEKLTFIVNLQAVESAGLYISSQLLQLGEVIGRARE